jgi:hypothetical protein
MFCKTMKHPQEHALIKNYSGKNMICFEQNEAPPRTPLRASKQASQSLPHTLIKHHCHQTSNPETRIEENEQTNKKSNKQNNTQTHASKQTSKPATN